MASTKGTKVAGKGWPKRRQWLDRIASDPRLTRGAKSLLLLVASRSDDLGKPVWGGQAKLATQSDTSVRSVRRYTAEAEALGYLAVFRARPQRGPDGRWCRRRSNSYYLRLPPVSSPLTAPRRVKPAGRCIVSAHNPRSHLADSAGPSTPYGESQPANSRPEMTLSTASTRPETNPAVVAGDKVAIFGALRAQLAGRRRC
jgi:hypothetical protein